MDLPHFQCTDINEAYLFGRLTAANENLLHHFDTFATSFQFCTTFRFSVCARLTGACSNDCRCSLFARFGFCESDIPVNRSPELTTVVKANNRCTVAPLFLSAVLQQFFTIPVAKDGRTQTFKLNSNEGDRLCPGLRPEASNPVDDDRVHA